MFSNILIALFNIVFMWRVKCWNVYCVQRASQPANRVNCFRFLFLLRFSSVYPYSGCVHTCRKGGKANLETWYTNTLDSPSKSFRWITKKNSTLMGPLVLYLKAMLSPWNWMQQCYFVVCERNTHCTPRAPNWTELNCTVNFNGKIVYVVT